MKAVLLVISFIFLLSASAFASVLVIEGYEEFKLTSLNDAVNLIGGKLVDKSLLVRRRAISALSSLLISGKVGLRYAEGESPIRLLSYNWVENKNVSFQLRDEIVSSLIRSLHDEDTMNKKMAVITLGNSGDKRAIGPLSERLKLEDDSKVIEEIEKALEKLSLPRSQEERPLR